MADIYDNYRMVEEVKERAVERGSGMKEFEAYDAVAKVEYRDGAERDFREFGDYHVDGK